MVRHSTDPINDFFCCIGGVKSEFIASTSRQLIRVEMAIKACCVAHLIMVVVESPQLKVTFYAFDKNYDVRLTRQWQYEDEIRWPELAPTIIYHICLKYSKIIFKIIF